MGSTPRRNTVLHFAPLLLIFCMTLMWQYGNAMLQLLQTVSGTPNREEYNSL